MSFIISFIQALESRRLLSSSSSGSADFVLTAGDGGTGENVETWVPYVPSEEQTDIHIVQHEGRISAAVTITFSDAGYRVIDWGTPRREGNHLIVDAKIERWTGPSPLVITHESHEYELGELDPGEYAFHFNAWGKPVGREAFVVPGDTPTEQWVPYTPTAEQTTIDILQREGHTIARVKIVFPDSGFRVDWGTVTRDGDTFRADAAVDRWTGPSLTVITPMVHEYVLGELEPGAYTFEFAARGIVVEQKAFAVDDGPAWEPYTPTAEQTEIEIFQTDADRWTARVTLMLPDNGFRVDWGTVSRTHEGFIAAARVEHAGGPLPVVTKHTHEYDLGPLMAGEYPFHFTSWGKLVESVKFEVPGPTEEWVPYTPTADQTEIEIREIEGQHVALVTITFSDAGYRVHWGTLTHDGNTFRADAKVDRYLGPSPDVITPMRHEYVLGKLEPGTYTFEFAARGETVESLTFSVPAPAEMVFEGVELDDHYRFFTDMSGENILLVWNNDPALRPGPWVIERDAYDRFIVNALAGDDTVVIDLVQHTPLPRSGMVYDGGAGGGDVLQITNALDTDHIEIVGDRVTINGIAIELVNVEKIVVDRSSGSDVTVGGADVVEIDGGQHIGSITLRDDAVVRLSGDAPQLSISGFSLTDDALFDLRDKTVLITVESSQADALLATLHELIAAGRAENWTGERGITSSLAAEEPGGNYGVGVAVVESPLLAAPIGADVRVIAMRYTLEGDLNLDGVINFDDYFRIDSAYLEQPAQPTYAQGDVNYDGRIDFDDYFGLDSAFLSQANTPPPASATAATASGEDRAARSVFSRQRVQDDERSAARRRSRPVRAAADLL